MIIKIHRKYYDISKFKDLHPGGPKILESSEGIDATANRMGIGKEKVMLNINKYGNTTNASIPLCLWEWENELKKGDNLILAAFGGGFTWGSIFLKWAYENK